MVEFLQVYLPITIYVLLIILIIIGIILSIRLLGAMDKVDGIIANVESKVNSLNGLFNVIDFTTDKIANISDRVVEFIGGAFSRIASFGASRRRKKKEKDDYYE